MDNIYPGQILTECYITDRQPATVVEVLSPTQFTYMHNKCVKAEGAEWCENKWNILPTLEGPLFYGKIDRKGRAHQASISENNRLKVYDGAPYLKIGSHSKYYCYEL